MIGNYRNIFGFLFLITVFVFQGCKTAKPRSLLSYRNSESDGARFSDSLVKSGVDTLICYYDGGGYMEGLSRPFYIYWEKNNRGYFTKFDAYSNYNVIEGSFGFGFIIPLQDTLKNLVLKKSKFSLSHDSYDFIKIKISEFNYELGFRGIDRSENVLSYPDIIIDKFRSCLLDRELFWRGQSYKYKRKNK